MMVLTFERLPASVFPVLFTRDGKYFQVVVLNEQYRKENHIMKKNIRNISNGIVERSTYFPFCKTILGNWECKIYFLERLKQVYFG